MAGKRPLTKGQVVSHIAEVCEIPKKSALAAVGGLGALAISETKKVGSFVIPGVGKLVLSKRKARMGRNPATGEPIKIPAKTVVKMRIAKACKEAIIPKR